MAAKEKIDLYKLHKAEYVASREPALIKIKPAQYLSIDGQGEPGGEAFQDAISVLYSAAFTTKMMSKNRGRDYAVCKLEAVWWIAGNKPFKEALPDDIHYKLIIRTPDFIKNSDLQATQKVLAGKSKTLRIDDLKLERLQEGRCVQMLHVGPYGREDETIQQMRAFAEGEGLRLEGRHHEIYLSDPRRVPPERLKTILRHPASPA